MTMIIRLASLPALLSTAAMVSACTVEDVEGGAPAEPEFRADDVPPSQVESACWAVAMLQTSCSNPAQCPQSWTCPATLSDGWTRAGDGPMFVDGTEAMDLVGIDATDLPAHLQRFCLYQGPPNAAAPANPSLPYSLDCPGVASMGNEFSGDLQDELQAAFEAHAGGSPSAIALGTHNVTVAIVDNYSSRAFPLPPLSKHAPAMADIVDELACNGGAAGCDVQISHALAMPLKDDGTINDPQGADYGTRAHLAIGIMEAVMAWKEGGMVGPLVINMSLGWSASQGVAGKSEEDPWLANHITEFVSNVSSPLYAPELPSRYGVEAVHGALLYAACHGATIVAAAGNGRSDSCNAEPVAPAVWAKFPSPTQAECATLGFTPPAAVAARVPTTTATSWPLVTPVSALTHKNQTIVATRPNSRTMLMGPGFHATTDPAYDPMTGTSVAAATITAAAALVLSQDPNKKSGDVTHRLWTQGRSTGHQAQMAQHRWGEYAVAPATVPDTRQVVLCRGQLTAPYCSITQYNTRLSTALTALRTATFATVDAAAAGTTPYPIPGTALEDTCDVCGEDALLYGDPSPDPMFPPLGLFAEACDLTSTPFEFDENPELAGPQPVPVPCPECPVILTTASGKTNATLSIDEAFTTGPYDWLGANLVFTHVDRTQTIVDLPPIVSLVTLRGSEPVVVDLADRLTNVATVTFNLTMRRTGSTESFTRSNEVHYEVR